MSSRLWSRVAVFAVVAALATASAVSQKGHDTGPKYNLAGEVRIKGVVEDIREVPGDFQGTHLLVKTDTTTVLVRLAPADFLKEMDTSFKKGDQVEIVGAKATDTTEEVILAREVTVGNNTCTLRDDKGIPVWAGWKPSSASGK